MTSFKNKLFVLALLLISLNSFSQDYIIKKNGDRINCKITSIDSTNIYIRLKDRYNMVHTHIGQDQVQSYYQKKADSIRTDKSFAFELNFNPFKEEGAFSFEYFQTKFWLSDDVALRLGFQFEHKNNSIKEEDYPDSEPYPPTSQEKSTLFGVRPGFEFHVLKGTKVSPYFGFEIAATNKWSGAEYKTSYSNSTTRSTTVEVKNAWREYNISANNQHGYTSYNKERAYFRFDGNAILGVDLNFVKHLYFGFEAGLGYHYYKYKKVEVDNSRTTYDQTLPSYRNSEFKFFYNSAIRLGFWF